jgi:hypothetical protein
MVCVVNETALPLKVMLLSVPVDPLIGSNATRFRAPAACVMLKLSVLPLHVSAPNAEEFRPSSQVNSCREEMMGTPRLWADATTSGAIPG